MYQVGEACATSAKGAPSTVCEMMTAVTVDMSMLLLFCAWFSYFANFNIKFERHPREGMVRVYLNHITIY